MRLVHISDLHLGKSLNGLSLIEQMDQKNWIDLFLDNMRQVKPDAIVIAGDIYDRSAPSAEAYELFDHLLTELSAMAIPTMIIAGNHDSGKKLAFANKLLSNKEIGIYISGVINKELMNVTLEDEFGPVTFWLMPYTFPAMVANVLDCETGVNDYNTAIKLLIDSQNIDTTKRNILIAHQNVICRGKENIRGGSETMVGGVGEVEYTAFDKFDYVALGHIHAAYPVGRDEVRYSGSPLCYHFDETKQPDKGPLIVEIGHKGEAIKVETLKIKPLHPLKVYKGTYDYITEKLQNGCDRGEYIKVVVTDKRITAQMHSFLKQLVEGRESVLLEVISEFSEFKPVRQSSQKEAKEKSVEEYFAELYKERKDDNGPDDKDGDLFKFIGNMVRDAVCKGETSPNADDIDRLLKFMSEQEGIR